MPRPEAHKVGASNSRPQLKLGLAHNSANQPGPDFRELHPGAAPAKITSERKIPLRTCGDRDRRSIANIDNQQTAKMADSDSPVTLRTRKFIRNPLLGRKQMVV